MKIWIHLNNAQLGPFTLDELPLSSMDARTPVWYDGLEYWLPANEAPYTAHLFTPDAIRARQQAYTAPDAAAQSQAAEPQAASQQPWQQYAARQPQPQTQPCPPSYLVWSVLLTVLCCNPIGIVAIVLGVNVGNKYRNYDYDGARRTSETTAWWLMITIVTSLMSLPLSMLSML